MKNRTLSIVVVVLAVLLGLAVLAIIWFSGQDTGGSPTPVPTPRPITGIVWEWTGVQDGSGETFVSNPNQYTITFNDDGSVAVQADCNQVGGSYTLSGSSLTIQLGASTAAFCGENSQDQLYLASLSKVSSYAADNKGLELHFSGGSGKMDFRDGGAAR